jgi:hypothetical protein
MVRLVVPNGDRNGQRPPRGGPASYRVPAPLSKRLEGELVLRTVTLDSASQSLTCLSTAVLCVPVKVLTFIAPPAPAAERWISSRRLSVLLGDTFRLVARRAQCKAP